MENFQRSSDHPNIKYTCVVLFLGQLYILFIYTSKYFLIDHHYKRYVKIYYLFAKGKFLLMFPQRANIKQSVQQYYTISTKEKKNLEERKLKETKNTLHKYKCKLP